MKMNHVRFVDDVLRYSKYIRSWLVMAIYGYQWLITPVVRSYIHIYIYMYIHINIGAQIFLSSHMWMYIYIYIYECVETGHEILEAANKQGLVDVQDNIHWSPSFLCLSNVEKVHEMSSGIISIIITVLLTICWSFQRFWNMMILNHLLNQT